MHISSTMGLPNIYRYLPGGYCGKSVLVGGPQVRGRSAHFNNTAAVAASRLLSVVKLLYYYCFATAYGAAGGCAHVGNPPEYNRSQLLLGLFLGFIARFRLLCSRRMEYVQPHGTETCSIDTTVAGHVSGFRMWTGYNNVAPAFQRNSACASQEPSGFLTTTLGCTEAAQKLLLLVVAPHD